MSVANAAKNSAPEGNPKNTLGLAFSTLQVITVACHAVLDVVLTPPEVKPEWFDDLSAKLDRAKANAAEWIDTLSVKITKAIPLQVINFAPTFEATAKSIQKIADANPTAKGKDDPHVAAVRDLIGETLLPGVRGTMQGLAEVADQLKAWGQRMQASHDDLVTGAANIQSAEANLQADINKMNTAINGLRDKIAAENQQIAIAAGAVAGGVFALVSGIALAFVTFGAGAIVAVAGAAAIIGGGITWGVIQGEIDAQFDEISDDQKKIDSDNRQLVALHGLGLATDIAIAAIGNATSALSNFRTTWGVFQGELQGTIAKLDSAHDALAIVVQQVFTSAAMTEWGTALTLAQQLSGLGTMTVDKKVLPMKSEAA